jgi:PAS domain S-box-containing protein
MHKKMRKRLPLYEELSQLLEQSPDLPDNCDKLFQSLFSIEGLISVTVWIEERDSLNQENEEKIYLTPVYTIPELKISRPKLDIHHSLYKRIKSNGTVILTSSDDFFKDICLTKNKESKCSLLLSFGGYGFSQLDFKTSRISLKSEDIIQLRSIFSRFSLSINVYLLQQQIKEEVIQRKRIQEDLHKSESYFRALLESSLDVIAILEKNGTIRWENASVQHVLGYSPEERIGRSIFDYVHPEDLASFKYQYWKKILRSKHIQKPVEFRFSNKDNNWRILALISFNLLNDSRIAGIVISYRDITNRKQTEQDLRKSEATNRAIINALPDLIFQIKKDGTLLSFKTISYFNPSAFHGKVEGINIKEVLPAVLVRRILRTMNQALRTYDTKMFEYHYRSNNNLRDYEVRVAIIRDDEALILIREITDRKRAERELKKSHERLRRLSYYLQSIREQERTTIAREIHDELGQLLTGLKIELSFIDNRLPEEMNDLKEKVKSMSKLTDTTIKTVRKIASELRPIILDDLGITAAIEWQTQEYQKRSGIPCRFHVIPAEFELDQKRSTALFRIFQETLTNVFRHARASEVNITLEKRDGTVNLLVKDNGIGISKKKINNPKSIGLLGIKERVHSLGGSVEIKGIRNKGTTVSVTIPVEEIEQ